MRDTGEVTALLRAYSQGQEDAVQQLLPLVYQELRGIAKHHRLGWLGPESLGTTSLVHEAYVKMIDRPDVEWQGRGHFFYLASLAMRNLLIDNARYHHRRKRGGNNQQVELSECHLVSAEKSEELIALDEALDRLAKRDATLAKVVECRFFGGLTIEETSETLSVSPATVKRRWALARTILYRELKRTTHEARA